MNIKDKAKELCNESGCHHKCHDTKDCVVEDEAKAIIGDNLPSTLKNEEKISEKEKQIEEMAKAIEEAMSYSSKIIIEETVAFVKEHHKYHSKIDFDKAHEKSISELEAERLYNEGWRKQRKGEWIKDAPHWNYHCNQCGFYPLIEYPILHNYCPNCGAKMKGGAE